MLNIPEIKRRVSARSDEFLSTLFADRLRNAGPDQWRVGRHGSLAIQLKDGELVYFDHEADEGGDAIDLWARERGISNGAALKACAAWAGLVGNGVHESGSTKGQKTAQRQDVLMSADHAAYLDTRPPTWPLLADGHQRLWRDGIERLENEEQARQFIARWRGWPEFVVRVLARADLICAPIFNLWPSVIEPQPCIAFPVLHPRRHLRDDGAVDWKLRHVQFHIRFHPEATRRDGTPLTWIYAPTKNQHRMVDGANAPLVIVPGNHDPEQPHGGTRCECVIVCAGEWDALTVLLASGRINDRGAITLPPGLAIIGIRGEGRGGTDAYLRLYRHWMPRSVVMLADADKTGAAWFHSTDGRLSFAAQIEQRGAKVLRLKPAGHKDVNDFYRSGNFGLPQLEAMLSKAGFPFTKGGVL
jgi:hypothetical protein